MHDVINAILSTMYNVLNYMRETTIADWGGYSVTLYSAAVSLLIYERILAVIFAAVSRFSGGSEND